MKFMTYRFLFLLIAFTVLWTAPATAQTTSARAEFEAQIERAESSTNTPLGLAAAHAARSLAGYVDREVFEAKVEEAALQAKNPLVAFELSRIAANARLDLGKNENAGHNGALAEQGCLRTWSLIGPFANESMEGFAARLGPELGEPGPFTGKTVEVSWRALPQIDQGCAFALGQVVTPDTAAVVYLSGTIRANSRASSLLYLGANGAYKVWVNGELVGLKEDDTGLAPDTEAWPIVLNRGANSVVVKLASQSSRSLGFIARLTDRRSQPLKFGMDPSVPEKGDVLDAGDPSKLKQDPSGTLSATNAFLQNAKGDEAIWGAWLLQKLAWRDASTPWRDIAQKEVESGLSPRVLALASTLFDEAWMSRNTLERAARSAPEDPFVQVQFAEMHENSMTELDRLKARPVLEAVLEKYPSFLPAIGQLTDWYRSRSSYQKAEAILERAKAVQDVPGIQFRRVAIAQELDTPQAVQKLRVEGLRIGRISSSYLWDHVRDLSVLGDLDAAIEEVRHYRASFPASVFAAQREAELLRAKGDLQGALQIWNDLHEMNPGEAEILERRAEVHMALEEREKAIQDLEMALLRRPQDQTLSEKLSFLLPAEDRFWDPYIVSDIRERMVATEATPFSYDTLVSQKVTYVAPNGLSQQVTQRVDRALTAEGVDTAKEMSVAFSMGDERVDILRVRVYKADGTISEDYSHWESGGTRKGSTTYNDTAYLNIRANNVSVGDAVEFQYRVSQVANSNFRGDYFGDIMYAQSNRPIAYQRYVVLYPKDWELFFRPPAVEHTRDDQILTAQKATLFEMKSVPHVVADNDQPGATDVYDYILASNKQTWDDIGTWWWQLIAEQLIVDDEIRSKVRELTRGKKTTKEKVEVIHNYVVRNTRYLHVGLGIHGWKPYRTTTAFRNRYGDCKDKAALLKVMLEEAGVEANMVLVRTRRLGSVDEFPASMHVFNHAITYVPELDLYLDGTAEFNGTTELTTMDQGAQALIVRDGGKSSFVRLPVDKSSANVLEMKLDVVVSKDGVETRGTIHATGTNAVYFRSIFEDPERRKEEFERYLASTYPGVTIESVKFEGLEDLESPTKIEFVASGGRLVNEDGSRRFVFPMGTRKDLLAAYAKSSTRTQALDIRVPFTTQTRVKYRLPEGQAFNQVPANVDLKSPFGGVSVSYTRLPDGGLETEVNYHIDVQRVAVEDYGDFREFMSSINDALNNSIAIGEAE
jgi:tetratricopeptide (TPR) repeat protein/transglutaminase-like putative cysteine protease